MIEQCDDWYTGLGWFGLVGKIFHQLRARVLFSAALWWPLEWKGSTGLYQLTLLLWL